MDNIADVGIPTIQPSNPNPDLLNFANFLAYELKAMCQPNVQLYRTGNMKSSITTITIDSNCIDIIIAVPYASYTNTKGHMAGWIERTIDRCTRAYASNNQVTNTAGIIGMGEVDVSIL